MAKGKRFVSSAALRETRMPQMLMGGGGCGGGAESLSVTHFNTYAMGWMVKDFRGQLVWQHGGNTFGMTAAVGMMPEKKLGVVVLNNMDHAALPELLRQYIFDRELGAPMRDWSGDTYKRYLAQRHRADSVEKAQGTAHPANATPPLPLTAYAGTHTDSLLRRRDRRDQRRTSRADARRVTRAIAVLECQQFSLVGARVTGGTDVHQIRHRSR